MEEAVIDKGGYAPGGCSPGGASYSTSMTIHKWGLTVAPMAPYRAGCKEHITVSYTRSNRPAMIFHRPFTGIEFFKKSHPELYWKSKSGRSVDFPCNKVPLRRVHVWKNRAKFVSLLKSALRNVEVMREKDCAAPEYYGSHKDRFTWKQLRAKIVDDRAETAAINFLQGIAFRNFFCV